MTPLAGQVVADRYRHNVLEAGIGRRNRPPDLRGGLSRVKAIGTLQSGMMAG